MLRVSIGGLGCLCVLAACGSAVSPRGPGPAPTTIVEPPALVPPGFRLPRTFEPAIYRARLVVDRKTLAGAIEIDGDLAAATDVIWLHASDLAISRATATRAGVVIPLVIELFEARELVGLRAPAPLAAGRWTLALAYTAVQRDPESPRLDRVTGAPSDARTAGVLHRVIGGEDYVFTNSEPTGARRIFPCIDEPDRKVPWQLTLDVPGHLVALANSPIVSEQGVSSQGVAEQGRGDRKRVEFAPTPPLPSYLVAFAVGPFEVVTVATSRGGVPIRVVVPRGRSADAAWSKEMIAPALAWLEDWLAMPYPYAKLDFIQVPHLGVAAMENPGLITVDTEYMTVADPRYAQWQRTFFRKLVRHELAHQWFGNLVTPRWWDDLWLSEGFAAWLDRRPLEPDPDPVLAFDATHGQAIVRKPVNDAAELAKVFDPIEYDAGARVLSLTEAYIGAEAFRRGVQTYLKTHAHGTATSSDLFVALSAAAGRDVRPALARFIETDEAPGIGLVLDCETARPTLAVRSKWPMPVCVAFDRDGARDELCTTAASVELPVTACPRWLVPAGGIDVHGTYVWAPPQNLDALVAAWPQLTAGEQRWVVVRTTEPARRLAVIAKLLADDRQSDRHAAVLAAGTLRATLGRVYGTRRTLFERWIAGKLGRYAPAARLDDELITASELELVHALGAAGDPARVREAIELLPRRGELRPEVREVVIRLAAADRAAAGRLLAETARLDAGERSVVVDAIARSPAATEVITANLAAVRGLGPRERTALVVARCEPGRRAELLRLADTLSIDRQPITPALDDCERARKALDPAIAALLAVPASAR